MKKLHSLMIAGIVIFLTGCPYHSRFSAGPASKAGPDPAILGAWTGCNPENSLECTRLSVYRFNENDYYAETSEVRYEDDAGKVSIQTDRYRVFRTGTGDPPLFNVQPLDISTSVVPENYFARLESRGPDELAVALVSDNFVKAEFKSSGELSAYLKSNLDKPGFFEPFTTFRRVKKN
jgi:hypothetical protein